MTDGAPQPAGWPGASRMSVPGLQQGDIDDDVTPMIPIGLQQGDDVTPMIPIGLQQGDIGVTSSSLCHLAAVLLVS